MTIVQTSLDNILINDLIHVIMTIVQTSLDNILIIVLPQDLLQLLQELMQC